ncbi:MAG: lysophospholipid acyltransferase family protein [Nitrospirae bacterium]|nr:lysophospholipid acyltransferase family protein [Nitrospirota bacterium]
MQKPRLMQSILRLIEAALCIFIMLIFGSLPKRLSLMAGEFLGLCLFFLLGKRRRIALKNIEIAQNGGLALSASPSKTVRSHFISLGRSFSELSLISFGRDSLMKDIAFEGAEHYKKAKEKGRGVLIITGHCGNWELLSLACSWNGFPLSVVARQLNNPYLNRFLERLRTKFGNKVVYKSGALKEVLGILKKGGTAGILMDQSVTENEAVITEFFGEKVYAMKIPALLAIKTGAAVVPIFIKYLGGGRHRAWFEEELKVMETEITEADAVSNTKFFLSCIEKYIKENPAEWLWIHRRWKLSHGRRY